MKIGLLINGWNWPRPQQPKVVDPEPDDELVEMANLPRSDTGVDGTIDISTMQGSHGPRVKWYPSRPGRDVPCLTVTLEEPPRPINHGLHMRQVQQIEASLCRWVALNRNALLDFWSNGVSWTIDEVHAFTKGLAKLP